MNSLFSSLALVAVVATTTAVNADLVVHQTNIYLLNGSSNQCYDDINVCYRSMKRDGFTFGSVETRPENR